MEGSAAVEGMFRSVREAERERVRNRWQAPPSPIPPEDLRTARGLPPMRTVGDVFGAPFTSEAAPLDPVASRKPTAMWSLPAQTGIVGRSSAWPATGVSHRRDPDPTSLFPANPTDSKIEFDHCGCREADCADKLGFLCGGKEKILTSNVVAVEIGGVPKCKCKGVCRSGEVWDSVANTEPCSDGLGRLAQDCVSDTFALTRGGYVVDKTYESPDPGNIERYINKTRFPPTRIVIGSVFSESEQSSVCVVLSWEEFRLRRGGWGPRLGG